MDADTKILEKEKLKQEIEAVDADVYKRQAFPPNRTCGEVVARKHLHHPHPKMGDKAMGGNSCLLYTSNPKKKGGWQAPY